MAKSGCLLPVDLIPEAFSGYSLLVVGLCFTGSKIFQVLLFLFFFPSFLLKKGGGGAASSSASRFGASFSGLVQILQSLLLLIPDSAAAMVRS